MGGQHAGRVTMPGFTESLKSKSIHLSSKTMYMIYHKGQILDHDTSRSTHGNGKYGPEHVRRWSYLPLGPVAVRVCQSIDESLGRSFQNMTPGKHSQSSGPSDQRY